MPTNEDRADWALTAMTAFAQRTRQDTSGDLEHDKPSVIGDLLADLMHFCQQNQIDFDDCLRIGRGHFETELSEDDDDSSAETTAPGDGRSKFVIDSYCEETDELFTDFLFAKDEDEAITTISKLRPYASGFEANSVADLQSRLDRITADTPEDCAGHLAELQQALGDEFEQDETDDEA